jgi:Domain of unknown function (DUF5134)
MASVAAVLAVVCLALAAFHVLRLVVERADPIDEASHAAMGLGMAAMFSPVGAPVPTAVWVGVFLISRSWFAAVALRSAPGPDRAQAIHHVVGSAAMLFMLVGNHAGFGEPGAEHAGHIGHGGGPEGDLGLPSVAAIVLAGYFAWRAVTCGGGREAVPTSGVSAPATGSGSVPAPAVARTAVIGAPQTRSRPLLDGAAAGWAHAVMAGAMSFMLLGMV